MIVRGSFFYPAKYFSAAASPGGQASYISIIKSSDKQAAHRSSTLGRWTPELRQALGQLEPGATIVSAQAAAVGEGLELTIVSAAGQQLTLTFSGCQWADQRCQRCNCSPDQVQIDIS